MKEIKLWSLCCKLKTEEQGPALALSLSGNAREAATSIDINILNSANGLQAIINKLDGLYLKDANQRIYVALKSFETYKRKEGGSIDEFLNEFDIKYNKLKAHNITLSDAVLGYRLIEGANLSKSRNELVRISAGGMSYTNIKSQLRKLEDIALSSNDDMVKQENDTFYNTHDTNDVY